MKKRLTIFLATIMITLLCLGSAAFAWPQFLEGRPSEFQPGYARGFFIWRDDSGFNLRTSSNQHGHVFSGTIRTDGDIFDVRVLRQEQGDHTRFDHGRDVIRFRFRTTPRDTDGIDFKIRGGSRVHFELFMDGNPIPAHEIHLGRDNRRPRDNSFSLHR